MPAPTMTSLELVDFINSFGVQEGRERSLRHDNFMKKVPNVLGKTTAPKFLGTDTYASGKGATSTRHVYRFPKREACLMAMSYSYELQAKVFDKMTALEQQVKAEAPAVLETPEQTIARALLLVWEPAEPFKRPTRPLDRLRPPLPTPEPPGCPGLLWCPC